MADSVLGAPKEKGAGDDAGAGAAEVVWLEEPPKLNGLGEDAGGSAGFAGVGAPKLNAVLTGTGARVAGEAEAADGVVLDSSGAGRAGRLAKNELAT